MSCLYVLPVCLGLSLLGHQIIASHEDMTILLDSTAPDVRLQCSVLGLHATLTDITKHPSFVAGHFSDYCTVSVMPQVYISIRQSLNGAV